MAVHTHTDILHAVIGYCIDPQIHAERFTIFHQQEAIQLVLGLSINMLLIKDGIRGLGTVLGHLRVASGVWECHQGLEVGFMGLGKVSRGLEFSRAWGSVRILKVGVRCLSGIRAWVHFQGIVGAISRWCVAS